jgi:WD40 repeat protein/serine/threonine protein kinase
MKGSSDASAGKQVFSDAASREERSSPVRKSERLTQLADALDAYLDRSESREGRREPEEPALARELHDVVTHHGGEVGELLSMMIDGPRAPDLDHDPATRPRAAGSRPELSLVGKTLGEFRILREIGRGGMGIVYLAEQVPLGRQVALKVLPGHMSFSDVKVARFQGEAVAAARLQHPNVVPVHAVGEERGTHFFAMEFIRGQSMAELIQKMRKLDRDAASELVVRWGAGAGRAAPGTGGTRGSGGIIPQPASSDVAVVAGIGLRVAQALAHAHAEGIVHRDVKPSNILLDEGGTPLVADFGLAKEEDSAGLTVTGDFLGTPHYMAPERVTGRKGSADHRSDLFSLGVTLYELLTLEKPFRGDTAQEIMRQITSREPRPVRAIARQVPRDLETIVMRAMEKDPGRRYGSAIEMATDLKRFLELRPVLARPVGPVERTLRIVRRNPARATAALLAAVIMVGGPVLYGLFERSARQDVEQQRAVAETERARATRERDEKGRALERAEGLYFCAQSKALLDTNPGLSLLLAIEGARRAPGLVARGALYEAWTSSWQPGFERKTLVGHGDSIRFAAVSPDGRHVVTASDDKTARVWDAATGEELRVLRGHQGPVREAVFDAAGKRVATRSRDGTARLWDLETGEELARLPHTASVSAFALDPCGSFLVTGTQDGRVSLWDVGTSRLVYSRREHTSAVLAIALDPGRTRMVTGSADHTLRLRDLATGRELLPPMSHRGLVASVAFSPDGRRLLSASRDTTARIWSADDGSTVSVLRGHRAEVSRAVFSPDGSRVLTAGADEVASLWDAESGERLAMLRHRDCVVGADYSLDGKRVVTSSWDGTAAVWDAETGAELARLRGHGDRVHDASFSPDGRSVVTASQDGTARLWETSPELSRPYLLEPEGGTVLGVGISPDGSELLTVTPDGSAILWEAATGRKITRLTRHRSGLSAVGYSPDGRRAITASLDGTARIWDLSTHERELEVDHGQAISAVSFDSTGRRVMTVSRAAGTCKVWDAASGEILLTLEGRPSNLWCAHFDGRGDRIVTTDIGCAYLWDAGTGEKLATVEGHDGWVKWAEFGGDDTRLLTASWDGTARVWDVSNPDKLVTKPLVTFEGHKLGLWSASFSPDGRFVVTASEDRTARIWDAATGEELAVLEGHRDQVLLAAFDRSGSWLATASRDGTVRLWPADPLAAAETRQPRNLTREEEDRFEVWPAAERETRRREAGIRQEARVLVDALVRELVIVDDVEARLRTDPGLSPELRAATLWRASLLWDDPDRVTRSSWTLVSSPGAPPETYHRGLRWARAACVIAPDNAACLNTLGVALYRAGEIEEALSTLRRLNELHGETPIDLAFVAMAEKSLGRDAEAASTLTRLRVLMAEPAWAEHEEARELVREAEALVGGDGR